MEKEMKKAIFLDRDNTLIRDEGYIHEPEKVELLPGVPEALRLFRSLGFLLIVVSNQSGIGRGYYGEEDFFAVNRRLQELLLPHRVQLDAFYFCPHRPDEGCSCRKPEPELVVRASRELGIDLSRSFVIGDKESDVLLAFKAGCRAGLRVGVPPFRTLLDAANHVLRVERWEQSSTRG